MKHKLSRRFFLKASLESSLALGTLSMAALVAAAPITIVTPQGLPSSSIDPRLKDLLRAAMDTIIPAAEGMPSASAVGGVGYLEQLAQSDPLIRSKLEQSLKALDEVSLKFLKSGFSSLPQSRRIEALKRLESQSPLELLADLRDYVYESYYTQPQVWKLIGYEFYPTNHQGPHMKPFDATALTQVKKMGKLYREVS